MARNLFINDKGLKNLGELVRNHRCDLEIRLEDLRTKIVEKTGYKECSVSTLSKFEVGHMRFNSDLVAAISAVMPIPHPFEDRAFTEWEILEIARENLDPKTGISPSQLDLIKNSILDKK